jgi:NitT/TauT family transport system permease protein
VKRALIWIRPLVVTAIIILVWEFACIVFKIPPFILPRPSVIYTTAIQYKELIAANALQTLMTTVLGFALAIAVGVFLGVCIGSSRAIYDALYPVLIGFNAIPKVAVVPLIVMWTGIGTFPAIITAFIIAFFPIVVNVATGLASVEPELRDVLRVLGATKFQVLTKVGLHRTLPYLFASLKIAITLAFIGSVVSETIASNNGIGFLILSASSRFQVPLIYAAVLVIAGLSVVMYFLCAFAESRMVGWAYRGQT